MAYAQWVVIVLKNRSNQSIKIKNVKLDWGKFYVDDNKDEEIPTSEIEDRIILPSKTYQINSCGRENASSGTEGSFDLVDHSGQIIRSFYWDCPWGSKRNTWRVTNPDQNWLVDSSGANLDSGALGTITVQIVYVG